MKLCHYAIPWEGPSLRIMQVSDVHIGSMGRHEHYKQQRVIEQIVGYADVLRPDIVAVTGDLMSRDADMVWFDEELVLLAQLCRRCEVIYTYGNHESDMPVQRLMFMWNWLRSRINIKILNNIHMETHGVHFYGLVMPSHFYRNADGSYKYLPECRAKDVLEVFPEVQHPSVMLAHNPLWFSSYAELGPDVVLSGHVHGGIVRVPHFGGILSPERKFFPEYTRGLYKQNQTTMVVSAGIGKFRLFNPPEIVCVDMLSIEKREHIWKKSCRL